MNIIRMEWYCVTVRENITKIDALTSGNVARHTTKSNIHHGQYNMVYLTHGIYASVRHVRFYLNEQRKIVPVSRHLAT